MLVLHAVAGDDFMIGPNTLTVDWIRGPHLVKITVEGESMIRKFEVRDDRALRISPNVTVSLGTMRSDTQIDLCFEAPRAIQITRGRLYRKWGNSHHKPEEQQVGLHNHASG